jgi:hypothetical protein
VRDAGTETRIRERGQTKGAIIHRSPGAVCEARERRTSARTDGDELAGGGRTTASCEDAERARGSAEEREPVEGEQSVRLSRTPGGGSRTPKTGPWEPMGRTGSGKTSTAEN